MFSATGLIHIVSLCSDARSTYLLQFLSLLYKAVCRIYSLSRFSFQPQALPVISSPCLALPSLNIIATLASSLP